MVLDAIEKEHYYDEVRLSSASPAQATVLQPAILHFLDGEAIFTFKVRPDHALLHQCHSSSDQRANGDAQRRQRYAVEWHALF